jgi:hypothetical protein
MRCPAYDWGIRVHFVFTFLPSLEFALHYIITLLSAGTKADPTWQKADVWKNATLAGMKLQCSLGILVCVHISRPLSNFGHVFWGSDNSFSHDLRLSPTQVCRPAEAPSPKRHHGRHKTPRVSSS